MGNRIIDFDKPDAARWYRGAEIPIKVIRRFARDVVEQFRPEKIILFGSYAYGSPHADSDVDILVVMPTRNRLDQTVKIHWAIKPPFPLHLLVRTPTELSRRLENGDDFHTEIMTRGKVLYEAGNKRMDSQGRSRPNHRKSVPVK